MSVSPSPMLLIGPKGCGAELCARYLHQPGSPWLQLTEFNQLATAPIEILEATRDGVVSVSYTHLDVYKRQSRSC